MRAVFFTFILSVLFLTTRAQDAMRMEDGVFANFTLDKDRWVQVGRINHFDLSGTSRKYLAKLKFGKRKLDVELYETGSGKLVCSNYSLFGAGSSYFKKDLTKSDQFTEVYTYSEGTQITWEVRINKILSEVSLSYSRTNQGKVLEILSMSGTY